MTRIYEVYFVGITAYIAATSHGAAKIKAMRSAKEAGYWRGKSLAGLRCRLAVDLPSDATVLEAL